MRGRLLLLWALGACAEPTWVPDEPPPVAGATGGEDWDACSARPRDPGPAEVEVVNELDTEVLVTLIDSNCAEGLLATVPAGESYLLETAVGNVHGVRDADSLYLYAHFRAESAGPTTVVVP